MDEELARKRRRMEEESATRVMRISEEKKRELESYQRQMDRDLETKREAMEVVFRAQMEEQSKLEDERLQMFSEDERSKSRWALCALRERKKAMSASIRSLYAGQRVFEQERQNKLTEDEKKAERRRWLIKKGVIPRSFMTQEEKDAITPMRYGRAMRENEEEQRQAMDFVHHLMSLEINILAATDITELMQHDGLELDRFPLLCEMRVSTTIYFFRSQLKRRDHENQYIDYITHLIKGDYIRTSIDHQILLRTLIIENPFPCLEEYDMRKGLMEYMNLFKFSDLLAMRSIRSYEEYKAMQMNMYEVRKKKNRNMICYAVWHSCGHMNLSYFLTIVTRNSLEHLLS